MDKYQHAETQHQKDRQDFAGEVYLSEWGLDVKTAITVFCQLLFLARGLARLLRHWVGKRHRSRRASLGAYSNTFYDFRPIRTGKSYVQQRLP